MLVARDVVIIITIETRSETVNRLIRLRNDAKTNRTRASWKVAESRGNSVVESCGEKSRNFNRLRAVWFHTVVHFFQIKTLKFAKLMI